MLFKFFYVVGFRTTWHLRCVLPSTAYFHSSYYFII